MNKMGLEEYKGVFVFAQQVDNKLSGISFELIGEGKRLADKLDEKVTAVLIGSDVKGLVDELAEYGADRVIVVDDPELKEYRTEPYAHALASVINEYKPEIVLVGATAIGRDLGPTVSARVATGLTADCTLLEIGDFPLVALPNQEQKHNQLLMTRPAFGGNTIATIACPDNRPQMATVRPGVMQKLDRVAGKKAEVIEYNPGFIPNNKYVDDMGMSWNMEVMAKELNFENMPNDIHLSMRTPVKTLGDSKETMQENYNKAFKVFKRIVDDMTEKAVEAGDKGLTTEPVHYDDSTESSENK